ncbi:MAG: F-box protein [Parachlamydiaceae bacterium]|nr:F-box protein [Parachlamydiaceae bacterium]
MRSVNYAHYNFQTVKSEELFSTLYNEYEADHRLKVTSDDKIVTFARDLGLFEKISAFFELLIESISACCSLKNVEQIDQRELAWDALKEGRWIRIIELEVEDDLETLEKKELFSSLPFEINSLILNEFNIPLLGLCSQVSREWQAFFRQNILWKRFFPSLAIPQEVNLKDYCSTRYVGSENQLFERIHEFFKTLELDQPKKLIIYPFISGVLQQNKYKTEIDLFYSSNLLKYFKAKEVCDEQLLFVNNFILEEEEEEDEIHSAFSMSAYNYNFRFSYGLKKLRQQHNQIHKFIDFKNFQNASAWV